MKTCEKIMNIVGLSRANDFLWFPHFATLLLLHFLLLLLMCRDITWFSIIVIINCNANAAKNGHIVFYRINILSWWQNMHVAFFVAIANSIICLHATNRLHEISLEVCHFWRTKETLLRILLRHVNIMPHEKNSTSGKSPWNIKYTGVTPPPSPQAPICLPTQNWTLNILTLLRGGVLENGLCRGCQFLRPVIATPQPPLLSLNLRSLRKIVYSLSASNASVVFFNDSAGHLVKDYLSLGCWLCISPDHGLHLWLLVALFCLTFLETTPLKTVKVQT